MNQQISLSPFRRPRIEEEYGHFIGGKWVKSGSGLTIDLKNPANGDTLAKIQAGNADDATRAVEAAAAALPGWRNTKPSERQGIFIEIARRLKDRLHDFAMLESMNNGKPVMEAVMFDIPSTIETFEMHAGLPYATTGKTMTQDNGLAMTLREPKGVCALVIPWNVPMLMMSWKLAPALITGNTVVLKPSEIVCLSVLEFVKEIADLLPPGVLNVITGYGPDVGEAMVTNPHTRMVSLTGSQATARTLLEYAKANIIPQTLELGGKSAMIVCEDADIEAAAEACVMTTVFNKGEVCVAGSRVLVHDKVYDRFLDRVTEIMSGIRLGDPTSPFTQLGAMASERQLEKVISYFDIGTKEGATIHLGGARARGEGLDAGYYIQPTIFTDVSNDMRIAREEIFGPAIAIMRYADEEEALKIANDSPYGLAGGLWTRDLNRALRVTKGIEAGVIWVNRWFNFIPGLSAGPYKGSGFGKAMSHEAALEIYTNEKVVVFDMNEGPLGIFDQP